jgi:tetratricopeptide (TPR) repeat protein
MSNSLRTIYPFAMAGLLVLGRVASAESPPLWGKLAPGPYPVGFTTGWQLDYARRFDMTFDDKTVYATGKAPRPILINKWYPAGPVGDIKPMKHRDYLEVRSADPILTRFSTKLIEYNRGVIAQELMGKPAKELSAHERELLDQFLDTRTACVRDAAPAAGKFPLVIYHAGHGSSFEDNAVLCEFLASHGYVVLGSAFQRTDSTFNVDGGQTSARDFEFLIAYASRLPGVDWQHVAVMGHSGGAHGALTYRAQAGVAADVIVSLDTTQDYYSLADRRWETMTTPVTKNIEHMTGPILMVANPHAFFQMADSLSAARRYYLTIKDLGHNDFIAQGRIGRDLRYRARLANLAEKKPASFADDAQEKTELDAVKVAYEALCVYLLHFLDAELKRDVAGKASLEKQYRDTKLGDMAPHVEFVPEGRTAPDPYPANSSQPPTPRQLRYFLRDQGVEKTIALMKRFRKDSPSPIDHQVFGLALVGELLEQGKTHDAIAFHEYYREAGIDYVKVFMGWGDVYLRLGVKSYATDAYKKVLRLDPKNVEAAAKLKEVEGKKGR